MMQTNNRVFPDIDTSYWKIKDKQWLSERKNEWLRIEPMLGFKSKKARTIIKHYFLKGKMPNWEMLEDWENYERHLDVFLFLWLHPSWDEAVLRPLRDAYMASELVIMDDIDMGFAYFLSRGTIRSTQDYTGDSDEEIAQCLVTGHNELLFKIMMADLKQTVCKNSRLDRWGKTVFFDLPVDELRSINLMGRWLCIKSMIPFNNDMLYQYDLPLEWWYQNRTQDEDYFTKQAQEQAHRTFFEKALWRIYNFDEEQEGPGPRTTFIHKIRKILNERPFIKEFETMWQRVKAGEIMPEKPWNSRF